MAGIPGHTAARIAVPPPPLSPPWAVPLLKDSVVAVYMLVCLCLCRTLLACFCSVRGFLFGDCSLHQLSIGLSKLVLSPASAMGTYVRAPGVDQGLTATSES